METHPSNPRFPLPHIKPNLPNAAASLVTGIISLAMSVIFCWCSYGFSSIIGLVLGILAVVFASNGSRLLEQNPHGYSESSISQMKAGKICGIIGLILSALILLCIILVIVFVGMEELRNKGYDYEWY